MRSSYFDILSKIPLDFSKDKRNNAKKAVTQHQIPANDFLRIIPEFELKQQLVWIAVLDDIIENHPEYIKAHIGLFLLFCQEQRHETAKRCVSRICFLLLKKNMEFFTGENKNRIIELHFDWLINESLVATKANCISVLFLLRHHSDWIPNELYAIIDQQLPQSSVAFKSRGQKIMIKLHKEKNKVAH